jgi:hypothetical protein
MTSEMDEEPQHVAREGVTRDARDGHDGLAAVAIALLTVCLIAFVVSKII